MVDRRQPVVRTSIHAKIINYMNRILLVVIVVALYVLHQDFWYWRTPYPLVFGFIPIGLFYQAAFSVAAALVMWLLVKFAWPAHLEEEIEHIKEKEGTDA